MRVSLGILLGLTLLLGGCPDALSPDPNEPGFGAGDPGAIDLGPRATRHESISTSEAETLLAQDAELAALRTLVESELGVRQIHSAGIIEDTRGAELLWVAIDTPTLGDAVLVRYCLAGNCVRAMQSYGRDEGISWRDASGSLTPRAMEQPYLLQTVNEFSGATQQAEVDPRLVELAKQVGVAQARWPVQSLPGFGGEPGKTRRLRMAPRCGKLRALSSFNRTLTRGVSKAVEDPINVYRAAGCGDAEATYTANRVDVDTQLANLGPDDIFILYAHGNESDSRNRVVGMSLSDGRLFPTKDPYSEDDFRRQLDKNATGGPGIVLLAGCATGDMLPRLDDPSNTHRVVLGFSKTHLATNVKAAMKIFMEEYVAGASIQEALDRVNLDGRMSQWDVQLVANPSADTSRRIDDEPGDPSPGTPRDPAAFPRVYRGTGNMFAAARVNQEKSFTRLEQTVDVEITLGSDLSVRGVISGEQVLRNTCPSDRDEASTFVDSNFDFSTTWTGSYSDDGWSMTLVDQGVTFVIRGSFDEIKISGRALRDATYESPFCSGLNITEEITWVIEDVPRGDQ